MEAPEIMTEVRRLGYLDPKFLKDGRIAARLNLIYTCAIVVMTPATIRFGYEDRWCYHDEASARLALEAWDGTGEPEGWHRHPATGRRRPDGNPLSEYINA